MSASGVKLCLNTDEQPRDLELSRGNFRFLLPLFVSNSLLCRYTYLVIYLTFPLFRKVSLHSCVTKTFSISLKRVTKTSEMYTYIVLV